MNASAIAQFRRSMTSPEQLENAVVYVTQNLSRFVKRREQVLICLPDTYGSLGWVIGQAVERCEANPVWLGEDRRWKTLIRTAFSCHCSTIVTEPLILLGLSKLAKNMGIPLFIHNAILTGYPCMPWMRQGMEKRLDCRTYGCFDAAGVVSGFIMADEKLLRLRKDVVDAWTRDEAGEPMADGEIGEVMLRSILEPSVEFSMEFQGCIRHTPCEEGLPEVTLSNMMVGRNVEPDIARLSGHLHRWTSILDCQVNRGPYGLELEIVTFAGEKLPKLPTCAKQVVRPWDPETEIPFSLLFPENAGKNH